jgi:TM2 domain-containing membrane protein YozV
METDEPDFTRGSEKARALDFEQRFLAYAYGAGAPHEMRATEVAHAIKMPIEETEKHLEDLAARDVLVRAVDEEGFVFYRLPGRKKTEAIVRHEDQALASTRPPEHQATMGLVLNLVMPGVGSIVAGKTGEGIAQLILFCIGLPLCFILIGIPLCVAVWGWALSTGLRAVQESQLRSQSSQQIDRRPLD